MDSLIWDNVGMVPFDSANYPGWIKSGPKKGGPRNKKTTRTQGATAGLEGNAGPVHRPRIAGADASAHLACESAMAAMRPGPWQTRQVSLLANAVARGA